MFPITKYASGELEDRTKIIILSNNRSIYIIDIQKRETLLDYNLLEDISRVYCFDDGSIGMLDTTIWKLYFRSPKGKCRTCTCKGSDAILSNGNILEYKNNNLAIISKKQDTLLSSRGIRKTETVIVREEKIVKNIIWYVSMNAYQLFSNGRFYTVDNQDRTFIYDKLEYPPRYVTNKSQHIHSINRRGEIVFMDYGMLTYSKPENIYSLYYHWRGKDRKIGQFGDVGVDIFSDGSILMNNMTISRRGEILEIYDIKLDRYMVTPSDNILTINDEGDLILIRRREGGYLRNLGVGDIKHYTLSIPFRQQKQIMRAILMVTYPTLFFLIDRIYDYVPII